MAQRGKTDATQLFWRLLLLSILPLMVVGTAAGYFLAAYVEGPLLKRLFGGLVVVFAAHELRVNYVPVDVEGSATLGRPLVSQGVLFPAGSPVESRLQLPILRVGYRAHWLPLSWGAWSLAPEIGFDRTESR